MADGLGTRRFSAATGRGVSKALRSLGADIVDVDVRDENFVLPEDGRSCLHYVHGTFGETAVAENSRRPRPFPTPATASKKSLIAFDKILIEESFLRQRGSRRVGSCGRWSAPKNCGASGVKPARQGSTVGGVIVKNESEVDSAMKEAAKYDRKLLVEKIVSAAN